MDISKGISASILKINMAVDLEELQLQVDKELCEVSQDTLIKLAIFFKWEQEKYQAKSKLSLTRLLRRHIEEVVSQFEDENECRAFLEGVKEQITEVAEKDSPEKQMVNKELEVLKVQLDNLEKDHQKQVEALQAKMEETELKSSQLKTATVSKPVANDLKQVLRRDFKINGQIGEPGQKDKLTFVSLVRQIESALSKGYPEVEVIDAVIRAITPSMKLRSYLETISNLTLPRLRAILRSHFQEKSATELYQTLTTIVQVPEESPQSFLIRALDLRQKVLFASKEAGVKIKYDESLVQGLFLHSLETGLHHEAVRTKLRPFLQQSDITDELLIEQMNLIVSTETERQKKFGRANQTHQKKVNNVQAVKSMTTDVEQPVQQEQPDKEKKVPKQGELVAAIKTVQAELAELKETFANQQEKARTREATGKENPAVRRKRLCAKCQETNDLNCDHCFRCGSSDHYARGCKKKQNSGNGGWLLPRDRK